MSKKPREDNDEKLTPLDYGPIVSRPVEPKDPHEIYKLTIVIKELIQKNLGITYWLDKETGEFIISAIDPFQLGIFIERIKEQVEIIAGELQYHYREKITKRSIEFHTKSANTLNQIKLYVEPLDDKTEMLILKKKITDLQKSEERAKILEEKVGWDLIEARQIIDVYQGCLLVNKTSGVQGFHMVKNYLIAAFRDWIGASTLAREFASGIKVVITDMTISEDTRQTGYGQIAGMIISSLSLAMLNAMPRLSEPINMFDIITPAKMVKQTCEIINSNRGNINTTQVEGEYVRLQGEIPASESISLAGKIENATQGRATIGFEFLTYKIIPEEFEEEIALNIRRRKGMPEEMPTARLWDRQFIGMDKKTLIDFKDKILSIMREQDLDILTIDRKYLPEFAGMRLCILSDIELPELKSNIILFLEDNGIEVQVQGHAIKFILSKNA
ncbi:MAG: hypothetical protein ACFFAS_09855 [Promethearchaeota archaeon]